MTQTRHPRFEALRRLLPVGLSLLLLLGLAPLASAQDAVEIPKVSKVEPFKAPADPSGEFTFATFNVENLFPYDEGKLQDNWRPKKPHHYTAKVKRLASTIVDHLKSPDLMALQEIYNPDVPGGDRVLRDLAREINRLSAKRGRKVSYAFARRPGAMDGRGIGQAFLYRKDRVKPLAAKPGDPLLSSTGELAQKARAPGKKAQPRPQNPAVHNTGASTAARRDGKGTEVLSRPLLVGGFEVHRDGVGSKGPKETVYVVNQHFKSRPDQFQTRRQEQAELSAALVRRLTRSKPGAKVIVAGDFNVNRNVPDHAAQIDPLNKLTKPGAEGYEKGVLADVTAMLPKDQRYSYRFKGKPGLLDWVFTSKSLAANVNEVRIPHVNSEGRRPGKGQRKGLQPIVRSSDHDPVLIRFAAFGKARPYRPVKVSKKKAAKKPLPRKAVKKKPVVSKKKSVKKDKARGVTKARMKARPPMRARPRPRAKTPARSTR